MKALADTRWFSWTRLAGIMVTAGLFFLIFQKLELATLLTTLGRTRWLWPWLAFVAYGLALGLSGLRWHLALRLTDCSVHPGAACRLLLIGHFFYILLFSGAGGDLAKSMIYARWHRFGLPEVLAAVPLDRGVGTVAAIMVVSLGFGLAFGTGGFHDWQPVEWTAVQNGWMVVLFLALAMGILLLFWRPPARHPWRRGWEAFWMGTKRLAQNPFLGRKILGTSILHQIVTHAVFAFNLQAVSQTPLPWLELSWTMPAITILSSFPVTFAGAGVREVASVTLLGLYGVPTCDAVAAAMLTLVVRLAWSALGGLVYWREEVRQQAVAHRPPARSISVVIPTRNHAATLSDRLDELQAVPEVAEILVVDAASEDETPAVAKRGGCRVLESGAGLRNPWQVGAAAAQGDVVWLLHPDTSLPSESGRALLACLRDATVVAGGFWRVFANPPTLLRGARLQCGLRLWLRRRVARDQAMFVRREVLNAVGGVPSGPSREESELARKLAFHGRLALAGAVVTAKAPRESGGRDGPAPSGP